MRIDRFTTSHRLDTGNVIARFYFSRRFPALCVRVALTPADARRIAGSLERAAAKSDSLGGESRG